MPLRRVIALNAGMTRLSDSHHSHSMVPGGFDVMS